MDGTEAGDKGGYGALLRAGRESRGLSPADVARKTKIPEATVRAVEAEQVDGLPPELYVRGFIRAMAQAVGISEVEPIERHRQAMEAIRRAAAPPEPEPARVDEVNGMSRRRIGIAVFVLLLLLVATITWRLLLRPSASGEGLSQGPPSPGPVVSDIGA